MGYVLLGMGLMGVIIYLGAFTLKNDGASKQITPEKDMANQKNANNKREPGVFIKLGDAKEGLLIHSGSGKYIKTGIVLEVNPSNKELLINGKWNNAADQKLGEILSPILKSMGEVEFDADTQDRFKVKIKDRLNNAFGEDSVYEVYITSFLIE